MPSPNYREVTNPSRSRACLHTSSKMSTESSFVVFFITSLLYLASTDCLPIDEIDGQHYGEVSPTDSKANSPTSKDNFNHIHATQGNQLTSLLNQLKEQYFSSDNVNQMKTIARGFFNGCSPGNLTLCVEMKAVRVLNRLLLKDESDKAENRVARDAAVDIREFDPTTIQSARGLDTRQKEKLVESILRRQVGKLNVTSPLKKVTSNSLDGNRLHYKHHEVIPYYSWKTTPQDREYDTEVIPPEKLGPLVVAIITSASFFVLAFVVKIIISIGLLKSSFAMIIFEQYVNYLDAKDYLRLAMIKKTVNRFFNYLLS